MERPLLIPLMALIAGICSAAFGGWSAPAALYPASLLLLVSGFFARRPLLLLPGFAFLVFTYGNHRIAPYISPVFSQQHIARIAPDSQVLVTGTVRGRPEFRDDGSRLILDAESVETAGVSRAVTGRLMVYLQNGRVSCLTGDRVAIRLRLKEPRTFGLPGEFDYRRFLALKGIHATGFSPRATDLRILDSGAAWSLQRRIDKVASTLSLFVDNSVTGVESGVLKALLIGERGSVPPGIDELYARGGVNHILSISGFHIGIIALVLYWVMFSFLRLFELPLLFNLRRFLPFLIVPILFWYLLLTGAAPATIRSFLMIAACFLGLFIERETDSLNLLALAAISILLIWPQALFDLSFQLSFLALWGILVLTPIFMKPFHAMNRGIGYRLLQFCMVSLAAILSTLLPVAYQFHRASLTGLISNLVVVPLLGYGAVVIGFAGLLVSFLAPVPAAIMIQAAGILVSWSNRFLYWLDRIPQLPHFTPSLTDVFLVTGFLAILTVFRRNRSRLVATVFIFFILAAEHIVDKDPSKGLVRVDFLSMGQCESTLVRLPGGRTMLVDGGGALFDGGMAVGERLLAPALWSLGVDRIDYMVLSHPHPDHLKGLLFVAENFRVGEFWESGYSCDIPSYQELKQTLHNRGVRVRTVNAGTTQFGLEGAVIEPLGPVRPTDSARAVSVGEADLNDESMVFRLVSGRFSMLFTGDSGFPVEAYLLGSPDRIRSTVLKVAHHGSRRSTSVPFLKAVSPRIALIAAGYRNRFNLPARETLSDIAALGAMIYRTDRDGTIEIVANPATGATAVSRILPSLR